MSDGIAPHQGCEVEMVMNGKKPLGCLSREKFRVQFDDCVGNPNMLMVQYFEDDVVFSLSAQKVREYVATVRSSAWMIANHGLHAYQRDMGRIFGYSEEAIQAFIDGEIDCDCKDCRGIGRKPIQSGKACACESFARGGDMLSRTMKTLKVRNAQFVLPANVRLQAEGTISYESDAIQKVDRYGRWL